MYARRYTQPTRRERKNKASIHTEVYSAYTKRRKIRTVYARRYNQPT